MKGARMVLNLLYDEQTYEVIKQRVLDNININVDKIEG